MEIWFIYALLSALLGGFHVFSLKVSAHMNHNSSDVTFYSMLITAIIGCIFLIFNFSFEYIWIIILLSFLNITFYFISNVLRIDALKYIDTTIGYPIYKTISSLLILVIGIFIFNDVITNNQYIGLIIGIFVPLLLVNKQENKRQKNLTKGLVLIIIAVFFAVLYPIISKYISSNGMNIYLYIALSYFIGIFYSHFVYKKTNHKKHSRKNVKIVGFLNGLFSFGFFYFVLKAYETGPISIIYVLNSFSMLIGVLLAIIIYKEHLDFKKGAALVLSLFAIVLLK